MTREEEIEAALYFALGGRSEAAPLREVLMRAARTLSMPPPTDNEIREWSGIEPDQLVYRPRHETALVIRAIA